MSPVDYLRIAVWVLVAAVVFVACTVALFLGVMEVAHKADLRRSQVRGIDR